MTVAKRGGRRADLWPLLCRNPRTCSDRWLQHEGPERVLTTPAVLFLRTVPTLYGRRAHSARAAKKRNYVACTNTSGCNTPSIGGTGPNRNIDCK